MAEPSFSTRWDAEIEVHYITRVQHPTSRSRLR
jgi:hypothetical protein